MHITELGRVSMQIAKKCMVNLNKIVQFNINEKIKDPNWVKPIMRARYKWLVMWKAFPWRDIRQTPI